MHVPDDQIVSRVLSGQAALFEVLMRRHNERLYRAAQAILKEDREADRSFQHGSPA